MPVTFYSAKCYIVLLARLCGATLGFAAREKSLYLRSGGRRGGVQKCVCVFVCVCSEFFHNVYIPSVGMQTA